VYYIFQVKQMEKSEPIMMILMLKFSR